MSLVGAGMLKRRGHPIVSIISRDRSSVRILGRLLKAGIASTNLRDISPRTNLLLIAVPDESDAICSREEYMLGGSFNDGKGEPGQSNAVSHGCSPARFRKINILNTGKS